MLDDSKNKNEPDVENTDTNIGIEEDDSEQSASSASIANDTEEKLENEEEYDEEYDDDDDGRKSKIIIISAVIVAVVAAVAGFFMYQSIKSDNDENATSQQVEIKDDSASTQTEPQEESYDTQEVTDSDNEDTDADNIESESESENEDIIQDENEENFSSPIPTSTPKPLPTATPAPVDTNEYDEEYDTYSDEITQPMSDDLTSESQGVVKNVLIGDLRFREMANVASGNDYGWVCSGQGNYEWLTDTAFSQADGMIGDGTTVLINIGINDIDRYTEYAAAINAKASAWKSKGATVYFVAVGPVPSQSSVSNQDICAFNTYMYNNLDIQFIDAYNHLVETGFEAISEDSNSYADSTSTELYNYINEFL